MQDQDQIDFHQESAIMKGIHKLEEEIDYDKAHRKQVQLRAQRLMSNPNGLRESFWRGSEKTEIDLLKQELITRKVDLQTKQWMERKEHEQVKESVRSRYDNLKYSFDLKYYLKAADDTVSSERAEITSPCFDKNKNSQTSASLKERIALNKNLTRSPKDGALIGVSSRRMVTATHRGAKTARSKVKEGLTNRASQVSLWS